MFLIDSIINNRKDDVHCKGFVDGMKVVSDRYSADEKDLICDDVKKLAISYSESKGKYIEEYLEGLLIGVISEKRVLENIEEDSRQRGIYDATRVVNKRILEDKESLILEDFRLLALSFSEKGHSNYESSYYNGLIKGYMRCKK